MGLEGWSGLGDSGEGGLGLFVWRWRVEVGGQGTQGLVKEVRGCAIRWGLALGTLIWVKKVARRGIKTCCA